MSTKQARAWVRQPSGRRLDLVSPSPFDWEDKDLAIGHARTFRWGGQSAWPRPMSVAQHALLVLELRSNDKEPLDRGCALRELLHDADEALLGFDCISPLKPILGEPFSRLSERLLQAVFTRYGVPGWTPAAKKTHKVADVLAAASEAVHVAGWSVAEVREALGIKLKPLDEDPLVRVYGGNAWEPWPVRIACERFLEKLQELTN